MGWKESTPPPEIRYVRPLIDMPEGFWFGLAAVVCILAVLGTILGSVVAVQVNDAKQVTECIKSGKTWTWGHEDRNGGLSGGTKEFPAGCGIQ